MYFLGHGNCLLQRDSYDDGSGVLTKVSSPRFLLGNALPLDLGKNIHVRLQRLITLVYACSRFYAFDILISSRNMYYNWSFPNFSKKEGSESIRWRITISKHGYQGEDVMR
jgi:hypothetical protein